MDLRSLISKMDAIEQGLNEAFNIKNVQAAVGGISDANQRHVQLAALASQNGLPGLYDPVDGQYVSTTGAVSSTADKDTDYKLSSMGLVPKNANTSTFLGRMFGTSGDEYDKNLRSQSDKVVADQTSAEFKQQKFAELQDLMKQLSALKKVDAAPAKTDGASSNASNATVDTTKGPNMGQVNSPAATPAAPSTSGQAATPIKPASVVQNKNGTFTLTKKDGTKFNISADGTVVKEMKEINIASSLLESFGYQLDEVNPHHYDSDEDYYAARNKKHRHDDDDDNYDDEDEYDDSDDDEPESHYEKHVRTKGLEEDAVDASLVGTQVGGTVAQHGLAKAGLQGAAKVAGKFVPVAGTLLSAKDAYERWQKGDRTGAVISALAGAGWLVPGPMGWVLGGALDAANLGRDLAGSNQAATPTPPTAPKAGGKSDPKILALQKYLVAQGAKNIDGTPLQLDGVMGKNTRAAMDKVGLQESQKMAIWRILTDDYSQVNEASAAGEIFKDVLKGAGKEAAELKPGQIVKDAQGANWQWMGGRWEKEVTPGSGKFNMNAGVATPGKGKTNAVAQELEAAWRAEAEQAKKTPGGLNAWIKANPKKAAAIGLGAVAAGGVAGYMAGGSGQGSTPEVPSGNSTQKQKQKEEPAAAEQVCSPEQIALIGKIRGVMGELSDMANSDPALAQVLQTYQGQIDALKCGDGSGQGATPAEDKRTRLEKEYDKTGSVKDAPVISSHNKLTLD